MSGLRNRRSAGGVSLSAYFESLALTLCFGGAMPKCVEIGGALEKDLPLMVVSDERMPREKQEKLIEFVRNGGKLLLTPMVPEYDEDFLPCTLLKDFLGVKSLSFVSSVGSLTTKYGEKVFCIDKRLTFEGFGGEVVVSDDTNGVPLAEYKSLGGGAVLLSGMTYNYSQFCQMDMLFAMLSALGFEKRADTDCKHLIVTLFEDGERATCFLINNLADEVSGNLSVTANGKLYTVGAVTVPAMSVLPLDLL